MARKSKLELIAREALSQNPKVILDIGYAQEPNLFLKDIKVYGVDIIQTPSPYEKTFICDLNTDKLPFKDGEVDVVTMGCTLAHVANPLKVLAEINRILPMGGTCILSSPNPNYYWENVINIFYHFFKNRVAKVKHVEHFFEFSRYNMRTTTERSGFEVVKEIGYMFQFIKTPFKFNPIYTPGLAYEIVYVLKKTSAPQKFTIFKTREGIENIPTDLFS